ncbi:DNA polymerase II small subunit [Halalkalicoccus paucihalophilus]|uniref:DNA polymerase II small subunit n=1 Tax=Halalkalicoccus paucihalophilus TaxID=1008153 RepID=A0A151AA77_9EURY|nr:metallophosphoesterase [Halalkalicoccus paucihalophilus]KYH24513.1 DNA polymerase II small subunit [Halalkalicoccus paucihalophilus]
MATEYVFISDLHMGGDEQLTTLDFEDELVSFLEGLRKRGGDVELIINGDAFGLWEYAEVTGSDKLERVIEDHPRVFEQLRATGEEIDITLMPGNHDYDLACYPSYVNRLAEYNLILEPEIVLTREVADGTVWIEHGQQHDANNRMPDWGNPDALPVGYFVVQRIVAAAGRYSEHARGDWLRDIQSVAPMEEIPRWLLSNYFYREMSPLLRTIVVPLLLFFNITIFYLIGTVLEAIGLLPPHFFTNNALVRALGAADYVLELIIAINIVIIGVLLMLAIPLWLFRRDLRQTLERFGVMLSGVRVGQGDQPFLNAAKDVFDSHPNVAVFVYGHTHRASLTKWGDRVVVNTGTWLKKLQHVETWFSRLPGLYYPSFRLNYFRIVPEGDQIVVEYEQIKTNQPRDLTWFQRLVARKPPAPTSIPERTVVDPAGTLELPGGESASDSKSTTDGEPERDSITR